MMVDKVSTGASSASISAKSWSNIGWGYVEKSVYRLQVRIAKAREQGKHG